MRTLFLGSYGFGNLGDELCLIEALKHFQPSQAIAFSVNPEYTARCTGLTEFIQDRSEIAGLGVEQVVIGGGGVGFMPSIRDTLNWMRDGWKTGAKCHIHNIGVGTITDYSWLHGDPLLEGMMKNLSGCSVRDHISWYLMREWPSALNPDITYYPEKLLQADTELSYLVPSDKRVLGISIIGTQKMRDYLARNRDLISRYLRNFEGWRFLPIVSTVHGFDPEEDDISGFNAFAEMFLDPDEIIGKEFLDRGWSTERMTPLNLKGVIGALHHLLSQRKHNCIHAIGTNVRFTGIFPGDDDSILRILFTLRNEVPLGTSFLSLQ